MKKKVVLLGFGVLLLGAGGIVYAWAQSPSVSRPIQKEVKGAVSSANSTVSIATAHFTAEIPSQYILKTQNEGNGLPLLLQQLYTVPVKSLATIASDQLAITVKNNENQPLKDTADVMLRQRSSDYVAVTSLDVPEGVLLYESTQDGYELAAFMTHENKYAAFVMTSRTSSRQDVQREIVTLIRSLVWR